MKTVKKPVSKQTQTTKSTAKEVKATPVKATTKRITEAHLNTLHSLFEKENSLKPLLYSRHMTTKQLEGLNNSIDSLDKEIVEISTSLNKSMGEAYGHIKITNTETGEYEVIKK